MILTPGSTSVIKHVFIMDSTSTSGAGKTALAFGDITAYYVRAGGALTAMTMVDITTLGTWDTDVTDDKLGFKKLHDTNSPGLYEIHLPNNILTAGANQVTLQLRATGAAPCNIEIQLANIPADVKAWLGTAAATPTTAGVPEVDLTHIAGAAVNTASAQLGVNVVNIEGSDATNQIRDAVVDDATRIDASALNTLSGHDPGGNLALQSSVDDLESRLTATRAGYLDNLSGGAAALQSSVDDLEGRLTADRALKLDNLDAAITSRLATAGYTAPDNATITAISGKTTNLPTDPADQSAVEAAITAAVTSIKGADGDTLKVLSDQIDTIDVSGVADAVWDELLAGHAGVGSAGAALAAAGASGDPWSTALPGAYGDGTAGAIIGSLANLPAAVVLSAMTVAPAGIVLTLDGESGGRLPVIQGEALPVTVTITDEDGNPVDCSTATFALGVKKSLSDTVYTIEKEHADFDISQAGSGVVVFTLEEAETENDPSNYYAELKIVFSGSSIRKGRFTLEIKKGVTE